jgi:hypothetical protein
MSNSLEKFQKSASTRSPRGMTSTPIPRAAANTTPIIASVASPVLF